VRSDSYRAWSVRSVEFKEWRVEGGGVRARWCVKSATWVLAVLFTENGVCNLRY
jgi:hypothetical protein